MDKTQAKMSYCWVILIGILFALFPIGLPSFPMQKQSPTLIAQAKTKSQKKGKAVTGWTKQDIVDLAVSPDDKYISYAVITGESSGTIYRKKANGTGKAVPITQNVFPNCPTYSPDSSYLVYTNYNDNGYLYRKNANDSSDGSAINNISSLDPSYSPDGEHLIYLAYVNGEDVLYKKDSGNKSRGEQIASPEAFYPKYTPDGRYIIYVNTEDGWKLYRKDANDNSDGGAINSLESRFPSISPDGKNIAYENNGNIYIKKFNDKSNGKRILKSSKKNSFYRPRYSANGRKLFYVVNNGSGSKEKYRIYFLKL